MPGTGTRSWTVLGNDDMPVVPAERFLAYLTDIERSPNTVKAYAHDLKDFWEFLGRRGLDWRAGRGGWKPFLHHVSKGKPHRGRAITVKAPKKLPRILTVAETQTVLDACARLRDRFFFAVLHETGCRAGEALGLRHEDIAAAEREIAIVPRDNANGARAKSGAG